MRYRPFIFSSSNCFPLTIDTQQRWTLRKYPFPTACLFAPFLCPYSSLALQYARMKQ
jgi:hypothetical protein